MPDEPRYYTVKDICDKLQVKDQTVWKWIKSGKLHAIKFDREYRIAPADLEQFLKERRK